MSLTEQTERFLAGLPPRESVVPARTVERLVYEKASVGTPFDVIVPGLEHQQIYAVIEESFRVSRGSLLTQLLYGAYLVRLAGLPTPVAPDSLRYLFGRLPTDLRLQLFRRAYQTHESQVTKALANRALTLSITGNENRIRHPEPIAQLWLNELEYNFPSAETFGSLTNSFLTQDALVRVSDRIVHRMLNGYSPRQDIVALSAALGIFEREGGGRAWFHDLPDEGKSALRDHGSILLRK